MINNPPKDIEVTQSALPAGASTEGKQDTGNTSLASINTNLGAQADAAAGSDTGTFSFISLFKRLLQGITSIVASLSVMDDWDESDRAKVNPIASQAGVQGGSGGISSNTQRVVLATDVALPAGTNAIGKLSANSGVDIGDTDVTSIVPGTGATNLGKAEDASHSSGDTGVMALGVSNTNNTPISNATNDYTPIATDQNGRVITTPQNHRSQITDNTTTISSSTSETTILAAVASTFLDLLSLIISNTSGTGVRVDFRDTTGGTVRFSFYVPPTDVRGIVFQVPRPQGSVNTNWTAQCSASVADVRIYAQAVKNLQ